MTFVDMHFKMTALTVMTLTTATTDNVAVLWFCVSDVFLMSICSVP